MHAGHGLSSSFSPPSSSSPPSRSSWSLRSLSTQLFSAFLGNAGTPSSESAVGAAGLRPSSALSSSYSASAYSTAAFPPSYLPPARLRCTLTTTDGGAHRAVSLQLGYPPQTLRLLVDTGSADLLVLNSTYCQHTASFNTHSCFNAASTGATSTATATVMEAANVSVGFLDDGEPLRDAAARAALGLANLPLTLQGGNVSLLLGAADVSLQDSLLGYPTAATQRVSFIISNPQTVFPPPIPYATFPYPISPAYNSLADVDGFLGVAYNPLSALVELNAAQYESAFLQMTAAVAQQPQATTFALVQPSERRSVEHHPPASSSHSRPNAALCFVVCVCVCVCVCAYLNEQDFHLNRAFFGGIDGQAGEPALRGALRGR